MIKLFPYQEVGVAQIEKFNGRVLLADEQGLGKTAQSIEYIVRNEKYPAVTDADMSAAADELSRHQEDVVGNRDANRQMKDLVCPNCQCEFSISAY